MHNRDHILKLCKTQPEVATDFIIANQIAIENLEKKLKELENRLNKNSSNSSKPPSSDGFNKPQKNNNSRKKSGKKSGGQKGHKGTTLQMSDDPDKIIEHLPEQCVKCPSLNICKSRFHFERRQIHDIPIPEIEVTEHRKYFVDCPNTKKKFSGFFPSNVNSPVSYGPKVRSLIVLIKDYQFIPFERLSEFMSDVFGISLSQGSIANFEKQCADNLYDFYKDLSQIAQNADVLHADETGLRIMKILMWLHVYSNNKFSYYEYHKKRGKEAIEAIGILLQYSGVLCHDFWSSYFKLDSCKHSMCNAHLLREMKAMIELYDQKWAIDLSSLLIEMKKSVEKSPNFSLSKENYEKYKKQWLSHIHKALKSIPPPQKKSGNEDV